MDAANTDSTDSTARLELEALYASLMIGQARIYDVLLMIYTQQDAAGAVELRKRHAQGFHFFPPPIYQDEE